MGKDKRIMKHNPSVRIDHLVSIIASIHKKDGAAIQELRQERNHLVKTTERSERNEEYHNRLEEIQNEINLLYVQKKGLGRLVAYLNAYSSFNQDPFTMEDLHNRVEESHLEVGKKTLKSLLQTWISAY